jgi:hypothetical protein
MKKQLFASFYVVVMLTTGCGSGALRSNIPSINSLTPAKVSSASVTIHAFGNSQTQGFYPSKGCGNLTCHPSYAWPQIFADFMGWTLDNQAYGGSVCADLTYQGTSESLWNLIIDGGSRNIYAHFRNDQSLYGPLSYRVAYARGCIEAQTAWLAIPEANKVRANSDSAVSIGTWSDIPQNSAGSLTLDLGATKAFSVTGKTVYLATARIANRDHTSYSVSIDGNLVSDPTSDTSTFNQDLDVTGQQGLPSREDMIQNFIRVSGLADTVHKVVYTCLKPSTTGCYLFYAAGISQPNPTSAQPVVYSLSPVSNAPLQQTGNMNPSTTLLYHSAWLAMVSELDSDGLQIIGIDAIDPNVYNPVTQTQADGVHPNLDGFVAIASGAVFKATGQ